MGLSNDLSREAGSPSRCHPNPHRCSQSEARGLTSSCWSPGLHGPPHSPPFIPVYLCVSVGSRGLLLTALPAQFSATLSPALSVYLCANVGLQGLPVVGLPAPFVPHSASLGPAKAWPRKSSLPQCLSPPLLLVWMYVSFLSTWCQTSLPMDFLSVLVVRGGAVCLPTPPSWFQA